ncbi:MAG: alkaline phosphatase family protein, partial [Ornithinibacter sp.]
CSPIRNPLPRKLRFATAALAYAIAGPVGELVARSAKVPSPPFRWRNLAGPWFDNSIAILEDRPEGLGLRWQTGSVHDGNYDHPRLDTIAEVLIGPR